MPIRVVIADDQPMVREFTKFLLREEGGIEVVGDAADGLSAVKAVRDLKPDVLLLDVVMPGMTGYKVAETLVRECPSTRIIAMTGMNDRTVVRSMMQAGARSYILKSAPEQDIVAAIRKTSEGGRYFSGGLPQSVLADYT